MTAALMTRDILRLVPHRPPFLMVDRVVALEPGRVRAYKHVSLGEPLAVSPGTGARILPRPLVIEAVGQAALILVKAQAAPDAAFVPLFVGCDCEFYGDVAAGSRLDLEAEIEKLISTAAIVRGRASVDGTVIADMRLTAAILAGSEMPA